MALDTNGFVIVLVATLGIKVVYLRFKSRLRNGNFRINFDLISTETYHFTPTYLSLAV